jgi:hypothetical protein
MTMSKDRKGFFHYLFTTALEGGISYWADVTEYQWSKEVRTSTIQMDNMGDGKFQDTIVRTEDLDGFYAIIISNEGDWGVATAYQPNMSGMEDDSDGTVFMPDDCQNQPLRIDLKVMEKGWNMFMDLVILATKEEDPNVSFSNPYFRQAVVQYLTDMEDGDSDADVADLVVQLGLFGEHVYS